MPIEMRYIEMKNNQSIRILRTDCMDDWTDKLNDMTEPTKLTEISNLVGRLYWLN